MFGRFFTHEGEVDYVIVGAGSAGCVLANKLSADPNTRVLLIEAGGDDRHWAVRIPVGYLALIKDKQRNWQFETEPQTHLDTRRLYWPRGRMLGGSSSLHSCRAGGCVKSLYRPTELHRWGHWASELL